MDLVARVLQALKERPVHPEEFERSACALLQARYPGLSAVEGGHDFGRDADIYFPFDEGDTRSRGRLLATTGDPVANLRRGLQRMQEEKVHVDLVVMACLGPVSASVRAHLDRLCEDRGLPPPHVYAQGWVVAQLVRNPDWRYRLLGVRGELGALLAQPLEMLEYTTPDLPALMGRDADRSALQSVIDRGVDVVLVGVPGVGKTRLTCELDRKVAFLQSATPGQVVDALVQMRPAAVVVDDAHTRMDELRVLRQARVQEGLAFSIIATSWPDRTEQVAADLPGAEAVTVERLERPEMDAVVRAVGVTGHRARTVILQQAEGRPGWALALCEVLVSGNTHEVVSGSAHLAYTERFLRRATESATALDALACVAALNDASPETVHQLAPLVGAPPAELVGMLDRLAHNGLLERTIQGWFLQPALRPPLIAQWFFTDPARRPWSTLVNAFPEHALALTSAAIAAARLGALRARQAADEWAQSVSGSFTWDAASCALLAEYATLDEHAARFAIARARAILAADRSPQQIMGFDYDPVGRTVTSLITQVARQWLLPEAVSTMLDLAGDDPRPRPQNPDHPLRVLADLARMVDPDFGTMISIRERLLDSTLTWLTAEPEPGRWVTAAELLAAIFSPEVSGNWPEPGRPRTVTLSRGYESVANLERLVELWTLVDQALAADRQASNPTCPPEAVALLVDLAGDWWRLGAGVGFGTDDVSNDQQQAGRVGARRILESLRPAVQPVSGLALRAQRLLDHSHPVDPSDDPPAPFDLDPDLLDLVGGHHRYDGDIDAELRDQDQRVTAVARRLADLGPAEGTARLAELIRQARLSGNETGGHAEWVAIRMRPHMADPVAWYRAAHDLHVPPLLHAALAQIVDNDPTALPAETVTTHLHDPALRPAIISAVLARTELDALSRQVIADLNTPDVPLLYWLMGLNEPSKVLHHLLRHPIPAIAGATALSFSIGQRLYGPPLPDSWRPDWATAVRNMRVNELDQNTRWRAERLLRHIATHDQDLFEQWFMHRLDDMSTQSFVSLVEPYGCEHHLSALPQPHRERLARQYTRISIGKPRAGQSLLTYLIGADRDLAERLLSEQTITTDHLRDTILGQRNAVLEQLGPLLLERGIDPEDIAAIAGVPTGFHQGPESTMHVQTFEYFASLADRVPALQPVAQAGCAQQAERRQKAEALERQERVRGD